MLARLRSLWRNLRHRDRVDGDLDHEVRAVFDLLVDHGYLRQASPPDHGRRGRPPEAFGVNPRWQRDPASR